MRATLALALTVALGGCNAVLNFDQCSKDDDCAGRVDGGNAYCTTDHLCVGQVPLERLCTAGTIPAQPAPDAIYIAGMFRLTGGSNDKDTEMANAARLAMEQIGQVTQRPLAMVMCDVGGADEVAARSAEKAIASYHVAAMVGPTTSSQVLAAAPIAIKNGVLLLTPSATSLAITNLDDANLVWRTTGADDLQAKTLGQLPPTTVGSGTSMRATQLTVSYVNSAYGVGLDNLFVAAWSARAGMPPKATLSFELGTAGSMVVDRIAANTPDYAVIIADDDAPSIMEALYVAPAALMTTQYLFTDAAKGPGLFGASPNTETLKRVRGTAPGVPPLSDPTFANFRLAYMDRFGSDPNTTAFTANTFDATFVAAMVVAAAAASSTPPQAADLVTYMGRLSTAQAEVVQANPSLDFVKGVTALSQGGSIDVQGASGPLTWDANTGDLTVAPIEVWGINVNTIPPSFCTLPSGNLPCP